ncbi:MAG: glutamate racemase [Oscillospiraceae bacterium]|nr:glutamate racemase [Oscillospiraceae bacterium]
MDHRAIGVFDSGLGGLTVVKELHKILPNENIVYLGDTGRVPYGSRSRETIIKYAMEDIAFLKSRDVKMIVAACGTVSSTLPREISDHLGVPYADVVRPSAQEACRLTKQGRVGVVGTSASIRSNSYGRTISSLRPEVQVFGNACPLLVHVVENGLVQPDNQIARLSVEMYLKPLIEEKIDTLILGCTHYPILYDIFDDLLNHEVALIDPGKCTARYVKDVLTAQGMLSDRKELGSTDYNVTDQVSGFEQTASLFLGEPVNGSLNRVELV